jgi:hypothetical protein
VRPRHPTVALAGHLLLILASAAFSADPLPSGSSSGDEQISRDIEEIMSGPDFRRLRVEPPRKAAEWDWPQWLKDFFTGLGNLLSNAGGALAGLGRVLQALAYAVLAVICALIIWLVVKAVNRFRARQNTGVGRRRNYEEGEADIPPGDLPVDEYLRRARELAEKGLFREAIAQLILGAMSFTERSGLIRFRRGLTHRDYLRALRSRNEQHQALRTIVAVYEPICFGRQPAQVGHYDASLDGYQTGFRRPAVSEAPAKGSS